jgi:hypothetical protein
MQVSVVAADFPQIPILQKRADTDIWVAPYICTNLISANKSNNR